MFNSAKKQIEYLKDGDNFNRPPTGVTKMNKPTKAQIKSNSKSVTIKVSRGKASMLKTLLVIGRRKNESSYNKEVRELFIDMITDALGI